MKTFKKVFAAALVLCLLLAAVPGFALAVGEPEAEDGSFVIISAPLATRAQTVSELYALEGEPAFMNDNIFSDVPAGCDYERAVVWANGKGIVGGYGDGRFGPEDTILREQLVTILWRYAKYKELDVSVGEETNILSYEDVFDISSYAVAAFQWACGEGIASSADGYLRPLDGLTPGEVTAIIDRFAYVYGLGSGEATIVGGWTVNTEAGTVYMPDYAREALDLALAGGLTGASYTPLAYLGSQVVAGINYAYLCKITTVTAEPVSKLAVVIVYKDLSGNASITDVRDVNIADYTEDSAVNYPPAGGIPGGWTVWTESTGLLPKDAGAAFDEAMNGFVGVGYTPAVLLGKQVVAGTNYAFLCAATRVTAEPSTALAVVIVSDPIDGSGAVIRSVAGFSIK